MFGRFLLNIIKKAADKEAREAERKNPSRPAQEMAVDCEPGVSHREFNELNGKFDMLCQHLKLRIIRPYGYQVVDVKKGGIEGGATTPSGKII